MYSLTSTDHDTNTEFITVKGIVMLKVAESNSASDSSDYAVAVAPATAAPCPPTGEFNCRNEPGENKESSHQHLLRQ